MTPRSSSACSGSWTCGHRWRPHRGAQAGAVERARLAHHPHHGDDVGRVQGHVLHAGRAVVVEVAPRSGFAGRSAGSLISGATLSSFHDMEHEPSCSSSRRRRSTHDEADVVVVVHPLLEDHPSTLPTMRRKRSGPPRSCHEPAAAASRTRGGAAALAAAVAEEGVPPLRRRCRRSPGVVDGTSWSVSTTAAVQQHTVEGGRVSSLGVVDEKQMSRTPSPCARTCSSISSSA